MTLDVLTERGQQSVTDEQTMASYWEKATGWTYVHTPKDSDAAVDAILLNKDSQLAGVAETKCRDMNLVMLETAFDYEWLVTFQKLTDCAKTAGLLRVPLFMFLYLTVSGEILVIKAADEQGRITVPLRIDWTETQATCNGGQAERLNAYIPMKTAKIFQTQSLTD